MSYAVIQIGSMQMDCRAQKFERCSRMNGVSLCENRHRCVVVLLVLDNPVHMVFVCTVGMLALIVAWPYYVRYSVTKLFSRPIPAVVLCRIEAVVCVASGVQVIAAVHSFERKSGRVESSCGSPGVGGEGGCMYDHDDEDEQIVF